MPSEGHELPTPAPGLPHLIVVVGLPGSGKSYLTKTYRDQGYRMFDDFLGHHKALDPQGLLSFLNALEDERNVVSNDVFITRPTERRRLERILIRYPEYKIDWLFYQNNPCQCLKNINSDPNRSDVGTRMRLISDLAPTYQIPEDARVIPVYKPQ